MSTPPVTADLIEVMLPAGAEVLVFSDLHLRSRVTPASAAAQEAITERLGRVTGPAAVVLNGDLIEFWGEPEGTVDAALDAHPALTQALRSFGAGPDRHVVVVAGNHDAALAWDDEAAAPLVARLGARCCLAADLVLATEAGPARVRCEHGHGFDPVNALRDPRNPLDSPLGQHLTEQVLPQLTATRFLRDLDSLGDPNASGQFVASRLL